MENPVQVGRWRGAGLSFLEKSAHGSEANPEGSSWCGGWTAGAQAAAGGSQIDARLL